MLGRHIESGLPERDQVGALGSVCVALVAVSSGHSQVKHIGDVLAGFISLQSLVDVVPDGVFSEDQVISHHFLH